MEGGIPKIILNKISGSVITAHTHSLCFTQTRIRSSIFFSFLKERYKSLWMQLFYLKPANFGPKPVFSYPLLPPLN